MKAGQIVRMSDAHKAELRANGSAAHVDEFGDCIGIVEGLLDYNNAGEPRDLAKIGPEVDVRWQPSDLRYGYHSEHLQVMIAYDQDKAISGIQSLKKKIEELHNEFDVFSSPWRSFITRSKYRHEELGFSADLAANDRKPSYSDSEETPIARLHTLSSELEWLAQHMDHVRYEIENIYEIKNGSCFVRHENGKTVFWSSPVASRSLPENDVVARNLLQFWKFALN